MVVLKLFFLNLMATASVDLSPCPSSENFKNTYQFLTKQDVEEIPSAFKLKYAQKVSHGCHGAAQRFKKVYIVLRDSGVDIQRTLDVAAEFSALNDSQTKNFIEIFQKVFLKKYFNFDFKTAYNISRQLSLDVQEGEDVLRKDFLNLVDFCINEKGMALPIKTCADISIRTVKLNVNSKTSIFPDWKDCYNFLREDSRLGLSQLDALNNLEEILKGGAGSCANFKTSFKYAIKEEGPSLSSATALELSKKMALATKPTIKNDK